MGLGQFAQFGGRAAGAQAAAGPGLLGTLGTIGGFLSGNPFAAAIAAQLGGQILGGIFGGESPLEQAAQQQLGAQQQLLPQLQRQAAGQPSAASQNIQRQLRQQTTARQQSFAAGQTAMGAGGTPTAVGLDRFRAAEQEATGAALAQLAGQSQQAILGLGQTGLQAQGIVEQQEAQARGQFMTGLLGFLGQREAIKRLAPELQKTYQDILDAVKQDLGLGQTLTTGRRAFSASQLGFDRSLPE